MRRNTNKCSVKQKQSLRFNPLREEHEGRGTFFQWEWEEGKGIKVDKRAEALFNFEEEKGAKLRTMEGHTERYPREIRERIRAGINIIERKGKHE